jgi:hypothetical protein
MVCHLLRGQFTFLTHYSDGTSFSQISKNLQQQRRGRWWQWNRAARIAEQSELRGR